MSFNNTPRAPSLPMGREGKGERESDTDHEGDVHNHAADNIAIRVQNLSKCYQIYDAPRDRLKQYIVPRLQRLAKRAPRNYFREFWALKDVSFDVKKGETIGIIGRNGSGKSTLLQIICGTLTPTDGTVQVNGRVAALLELGAGFDPEFTGRENVYMNAAILGLSREEINAKYVEMAAFADIGEFIDQPVKTYSSGMYVRLAFAVQACVDPDVLVVDEALAVGDAPFQAKCFARMRQLISTGTTIILVTHDLSSVRAFCSSAIYLKNGVVQKNGPAKDVCDLYTMDCITAVGVQTQSTMVQIDSTASNDSNADSVAAHGVEMQGIHEEFEKHAACNRSGTGSVRIINFYFESLDGRVIKEVEHDQHFKAVFVLEAQTDFDREVHLAVAIKDLKGVEYLEVRDSHYVEPLRLRAKQLAIAKMLLTLPLRAREYYATVGMLGFSVGEKYKDGCFNFSSAELCDLIEYGYFFSVKPFYKFYIRSAVYQESKLIITHMDRQ